MSAETNGSDESANVFLAVLLRQGNMCTVCDAGMTAQNGSSKCVECEAGTSAIDGQGFCAAATIRVL